MILADAIERHRDQLSRVEDRHVRELLGPLETALEDAVARLAAPQTTFQRARLAQTLGELQAALIAAQRELGEALPPALVELGAAESTFAAGMLSRAVGVSFDSLPLVSLEQLVRGPIIGGHVMSESLARQRVDLLNALRVSTSSSVIEGEGIDAAARRFRRAANVSRSSAEAWVRTSILTTENRAALETYRASGVVTDALWLTATDERTCPICKPLNRKSLRDFGGQPPPAHFQCRCTLIPVVSTPAELLRAR